MKLRGDPQIARVTAVPVLCLVAITLILVESVFTSEPAMPWIALGLGAVFVITFRPKIILYGVVVVAILMLRPNIWSAELGVAAVAFFVVLGFCSLASGRFTSNLDSSSGGMAFVPVWLAVAYLVVLIRAGATGADAVPILAGAVVDVAVVVTTLMVLHKRTHKLIAVRIFVGLTAAVCLSYVVTLGMWGVAGFGTGRIATVPGAFLDYDVPVHFPFTPVISHLQVFGVSVPRFTGFGREPGWMAMYAGTAYLLFRYTGWKNKFVRSALLVGLLGTLSTAGFGVFAVTIALSIMIAPGEKSKVARRALGLTLLAGGIYAALFAPVLGLASKGETNALSLDERQLATNAGLRALMTDPFAGGLASGNIPNVNLVAAIAANGVLYVCAISLAVFCVFLKHPQRAQLLPPIIGIYGTLLTAQPANGSTFVFSLVLICAAATRDPRVVATADPARGGRKKSADAHHELAQPYPNAAALKA